MRYFIVGYPKMYNMQYGIYDYKIVELSTLEEARKLGIQLSHEVIDILCHPTEEWFTPQNYVEDNGLEKWDEKYRKAYNMALEDIITKEIAFRIWEVKSDTNDEAIRLWANGDDDINDFVKRYCTKELFDFN